MALSDERLDELRQSDNGELNFVTLRAFRLIARVIEAEARAQDTAPIRRFIEAVTRDRIDWEDWPDDSRKAFDSLRAHLLDSDLSKLTDRGAKAWAGVDAQKLREGKAP